MSGAVAVTDRSLTTFHFGGGRQRLFGCWHRASQGRARGVGVVLCYPLSGEYFRSHRAFRRLGTLLHDAGFDVLRFDYSGCGDSSGESEDCRLFHWRRDVGQAIDALRQRSGCDRVAVVGLRLGATLALQATASRHDVAALILWDPIVDGREYLDGLQQHGLADLNAAPPEVMGAALSVRMCADLAAVALSGTSPTDLPRTLVVDAGEEEPDERLAALAQSLSPTGEYRHIATSPFWAQDLYKALVPTQALDEIAGWLMGVCA